MPHMLKVLSSCKKAKPYTEIIQPPARQPGIVDCTKITTPFQLCIQKFSLFVFYCITTVKEMSIKFFSCGRSSVFPV